MMKVFFKIFIVWTILLCPKLVADDQICVRLPLDSLAISEEGLFLIEEGMNPLPLSELHFEDGYFYILCSVPDLHSIGYTHLSNTNFSESNLNILERETKERCYISLSNIPLLLDQALALTPTLAVSGYITGGVSKDTEGNTSGEAKTTIVSDDGKKEIAASGKIERDKEGRTRAEGKLEGTYKF